MNNETHTIRLTNGTQFVRFETTLGSSWVTLHNSAKEAGCIRSIEAQVRIAALIAAGWRAE